MLETICTVLSIVIPFVGIIILGKLNRKRIKDEQEEKEK